MRASALHKNATTKLRKILQLCKCFLIFCRIYARKMLFLPKQPVLASITLQNPVFFPVFPLSFSLSFSSSFSPPSFLPIHSDRTPSYATSHSIAGRFSLHCRMFFDSFSDACRALIHKKPPCTLSMIMCTIVHNGVTVN